MSAEEEYLVTDQHNFELLYGVLSRVASTLGIQSERSDIDMQILVAEDPDLELSDAICLSARQLGIAIQSTDVRQPREIFELVRDGFPVVMVTESSHCEVWRRVVGRRIEIVTFTTTEALTSYSSLSDLRRKLNSDSEMQVLVAKTRHECDAISSSPVHLASHHHPHRHLSPTRRFLGLLRMDARDIGMVALFAAVAGVLSLAIPLAVESLVNVVSWGTYLQPLLVLAFMLLTCLGFSAALRILQTIVVEIIQRRQLVRIVSDLAHRFPRADRNQLESENSRELANRVFDIMTIQKATAILLLDGMSILLTTVLGLLLLAFYHPFLLGFDIVLLICMISVTLFLGRGGIRTAIEESITKYNIAHWLQNVLDFPATFSVNGAEALAIDRASRLAAEYVQARKSQFRVVLRQVIFAVGLQVVASTALLGLGGWLVIQGQLTLGQLVASELVVTVVVGAFSKAGKSLEKYYDLMAGIDKVGHLLDIPTVPQGDISLPAHTPLQLQWDALELSHGASSFDIPPGQADAGSLNVVLGLDRAQVFIDALAGLRTPKSGVVEIGGVVASHFALAGRQGQCVGLAAAPEIFRGSVIDNIQLGRAGVGRGRVREVLQQVGLWNSVARLDQGLDAQLQTGGFPLNSEQRAKLMIARALAAGPGLLLIDGLLDLLSEADRHNILQLIQSSEVPSTVFIRSNLASLEETANQCLDFRETCLAQVSA